MAPATSGLDEGGKRHTPTCTGTRAGPLLATNTALNTPNPNRVPARVRGFVLRGVLLLALFPVWTVSVLPAAGCESSEPGRDVSAVFVEPDDGRDPVIDEFDAARCSIDLGIYLLADPLVVDALVAAHQRGVVVRVLIEEHPFGGDAGDSAVTERVLDSAGVPWRAAPDRFRFSHDKYAVIDGRVAMVMNLNLTTSAFERNREFGVVTTDASTVSQLAAVFESDWMNRDEPDPPGPAMLSPSNARSMLIGVIDGAERSIAMYAEVIRDDAVVQALVSAAGRGVQVRLVVNEAVDDLDFSIYSTLLAGGVEIRSAPHLYIHAKAMLIDGTTVIIGSHNPTGTSLDDNREVSLVVTDVWGVTRVGRVFEGDWMRSRPLFSSIWPGDTVFGERTVDIVC